MARNEIAEEGTLQRREEGHCVVEMPDGNSDRIPRQIMEKPGEANLLYKSVIKSANGGTTLTPVRISVDGAYQWVKSGRAMFVLQ